MVRKQQTEKRGGFGTFHRPPAADGTHGTHRAVGFIALKRMRILGSPWLGSPGAAAVLETLGLLPRGG